MPEYHRKQSLPFVASAAALGLLLAGAGALSRVAGTEHPGRFLLARARGGRFVEIGDGVLQVRANDCGPAALAHCLRRLGEEAPYPDPACRVPLTPRGCRMDALAEEAERRGWETRARRLPPSGGLETVAPPAILHAREGHYLVFEGFREDGTVMLHDPALGRVMHSPRSLARRWSGHVLEIRAPAGGRPWRPRGPSVDAVVDSGLP